MCTSVFHERHRRFFYLFSVHRTLLEFQSNDEALWIYFDSHSNHIMERMNSEHSSSIKVVEGMKTSFFLFVTGLKNGSRILEALRDSEPSSAEISLQEQLQNAMSLLEAKKDDVLLGVCAPPVF